MTEQQLQNTISLLARFPRALKALLRDLPEVCTFGNEGENTWRVFDVVAHLAHTERINWMPRVRTVLQFGESQTFGPLNREAHLQESPGKSLEQLLDEFARLRSENLVELRELNLEPKDLKLGGRHPVFGRVHLSELLATWATHDLTHLHQLSRLMAYQYRDAVGPFIAYLGVLQCNGHSSSG